MGISRQIGWGAKENLLYGISRQVEQLTKVFSRISFAPPTPPVIPTLALTFDSIANADILVGDASNVSDWNTFFDLPTYGSPFTSVEIAKNAVNLRGGSNITIKNYILANNTHLIEVIDNACVISMEFGVFDSCTKLTTISLPKLVILNGGNFYYCIALVNVNLPELTTLTYPIASGTFFFCTALTSVNLPKLTNIGDYDFDNCTSLTTISLPSCVNLGTTVGNNNVFRWIELNTITLTIPAALMICNGGAPDGDITDLQSRNTVTIIQV